MADRIIKPDSGNDVVVQNNAGTRKIEVTNAGDVEVTGDFKATTLKATNLKANDGTASLEIADSTGDIGFSANTNLKIKLPSAGGIYESDGSTEIITESGGTVTLKNTTIDSTVTFRTGQIISCKQWIDTSGDTTVLSNDLTALHESSATLNSFSATSGNSYLLSFTGNIKIDTDGSNVRSRAGTLQLRYGTSAIADEATSLGSNSVQFTDNQIGRGLIGASVETAPSYVPISLDFIFTATSTATHYFNLVGNAGNVRNLVMFKNSNNPLVTRYFEIQGDVTA